jgi:hypothetical protein
MSLRISSSSGAAERNARFGQILSRKCRRKGRRIGRRPSKLTIGHADASGREGGDRSVSQWAKWSTAWIGPTDDHGLKVSTRSLESMAGEAEAAEAREENGLTVVSAPYPPSKCGLLPRTPDFGLTVLLLLMNLAKNGRRNTSTSKG